MAVGHHTKYTPIEIFFIIFVAERIFVKSMILTTKKAYMQEIGIKSGDIFEILVICHCFFEKLYNEEQSTKYVNSA